MRHREFLKLAFPLDVHAERHAAETQFGHFHRPTHTNREAAKFEACNHRFVHLDFEVADVTATDLRERPLHGTPGTPSYDGRRIALRLRPFELMTLRLRRSEASVN